MSDLAPERESIRLAEYAWMLKKYKWIILTCIIISLALSIFITAKTTPVYRASSTFIFDPSSKMSQTLGSSGLLWFELGPLRNNQIQIIQSRSMAEAVADSILCSPNADSLLNVLFSSWESTDRNIHNALVSLVSRSTSVAVMKDTDFFVLSAIGYTPVAASTMANLVVHTYYRRNLNEARGENRMIRDFLFEQLSIIESELAMNEESLTVFREIYGIADLDTEVRNIVNQLSSLESSAAVARTEQSVLETRRDYYEDRLESDRSNYAEELATLNNTYIQQLQSDLAVLEASRASLLARGSSEDDSVIESLDNDIAVRRDELTLALETVAVSTFPANPAVAVEEMVSSLISIEAQLRGENIRETTLNAAIAELEDSIASLPQTELTLARLERNQAVSEEIYLMLRSKYEEVRIAEAGRMGNVIIVDTALPGVMTKPDAKRNIILGVFAGLVIGIGLVILIEQFDTSVKNPEDIEQLGIPVIGVIPKMSGSKVKTPQGGMDLVMRSAPRQPASEAYRDFRTSLRFTMTDSEFKLLLITSAGPREGKSTTAGNLAIAVAQTGKKVLLVDTDMRRPVIHKMFDCEREPGLSEVVAGMIPMKEAIKHTGTDNLSVLTCGFVPPNPAELLGSDKFRELLKELRESWDFVIFDSPPVAVVTDAILISSETDATVIVVGAKTVDRKVLKSAWSKIERTSALLAGALLNSFDPIRMYTQYSYYTYRYHYYYSEGSKKRAKRRIKSLGRHSKQKK